MAVVRRAFPRGPSVVAPSRRLPRALLMPLLLPLLAGVTLTGAGATLADRPLLLSADQARERGLAIGMHAGSQLGESLLTVDLPAGDGSPDPRRLLSATLGGDLAAVADQVGPDATALALVRADGAQLRVSIPGILAAAFSPDGSWLAAIDGAGSLLRISTADGSMEPMADGPFLGTPLIDATGTVSILRVASVEAPFSSRAVRLDPSSGAQQPLADEALVYSITALDDGTLALAAHRPDGGVLVRVDGSTVSEVARVEPGAVHVAVAVDGRAMAFEWSATIWVQEPGGAPRSLGSGTRPRFAPDGRAILVDGVDGVPTLLAVDGSDRLPLAAHAATFIACGGGCGS